MCHRATKPMPHNHWSLWALESCSATRLALPRQWEGQRTLSREEPLSTATRESLQEARKTQHSQNGLKKKSHYGWRKLGLCIDEDSRAMPRGTQLGAWFFRPHSSPSTQRSLCGTIKEDHLVVAPLFHSTTHNSFTPHCWLSQPFSVLIISKEQFKTKGLIEGGKKKERSILLLYFSILEMLERHRQGIK